MNREETTNLASSAKVVKTEETDATRLVTDSNMKETVSKENQPSIEKELSFGQKFGKTAAGFAGGVLLGGVATIGTTMLTSSANAEEIEGGANEENTDAVVEEPQTDNPEWVDETIEISQNVNDEMSFAEAFKTAREEVGVGGAFEWRGNVYSTYTAEEWDGMSDEEKQEYNTHFDWTRYQTNVEPVPMPEPEPEPMPEPEPEPKPDDVEILGLDYDPETGVLVGGVTIEGSDVYLIDIDPGQDDGTFDVAVVDINGDGEITEEEIFDVSEENLSVNQFAYLVDDNPVGEMYATGDSLDYSNSSDDMLS